MKAETCRHCGAKVHWNEMWQAWQLVIQTASQGSRYCPESPELLHSVDFGHGGPVSPVDDCEGACTL